jgi:membrane protein implicated in regulation of membrane protease activity
MRGIILVALGLAAIALMYFWWLPVLLSFLVAALMAVCLGWERIGRELDYRLTKAEITDAARQYGRRW